MQLLMEGLGTAVPANRHDVARSLATARMLLEPDPEQDTWLPSLFEKSGIVCKYNTLSDEDIRVLVTDARAGLSAEERKNWQGPSVGTRMRYYERDAPPLALNACRQALEAAGTAVGSITHLVTVSCTGFTAPGIDLAVIDGLGLDRGVERTLVGYMGCHGALNGLRVARGLVSAEPGARVLVCAVELCTLHCAFSWDPGRVVANALFADGAAAVICRGIDQVEDAPGWRLAASGSQIVAGTGGSMGWIIGDHGFEMSLSKDVPRKIEATLGPWLREWLAKQHLTVDAIRSWAVHPGGPRILDATENSLGMANGGLADSRGVLRDYGNMSSPTLLFIAKRMMERRAELPCVMLGFGPGLAIEAALWV